MNTLPLKPIGGPTLLERISSAPTSLPQKPQAGPSPATSSRKRKDRDGDRDGRAEERYVTPWVQLQGSDSREVTTMDLLHDEIVAFEAYTRSTVQESKARELLTEMITKLVRARWDGTNVHTFGSVAFGLEMPGGDIDLVLEFPYALSPKERKTRLFQLSAMLRNAGVAESVNVVAHARVPIITLQTKEALGSYSIDMSIRTEDDAGLKAIPIVKELLNTMASLRPLILLVKTLLSRHGLNSAATSSLSSYCVINLCASYLQRNPSELAQSLLADPYTDKFLGTLSVDLLNYYASDFPYSTHYISVTRADVFPKKDKNWTLEGQPDLLSIQCLVNEDKDVGRGCGKIKQVRELFEEAQEAMSRPQPTETEGAVSQFGGLIAIPQTVVNRRKRLAELMDSGAFEAATFNIAIQSVRPPQLTHFSYDSDAQWNRRPELYSQHRNPGGQYRQSGARDWHDRRPYEPYRRSREWVNDRDYREGHREKRDKRW